MTYANLAAHVRTHIGQKHRYEHTVRVARCADVLAQRHGLDARKARLAGMLHDLARLYPGPRLISECELRAMPISTFERANPIVLHARLGASLAQEAFGVHDPEVLSAIEKHTVGAETMSPLDCAVYLADGLEPGRDYPHRREFWDLAARDLTEGMRAVLQSTLEHLARKGIPVAPQTLGAARQFGVFLEEAEVSAS
ncbi:MAG TPA: bis(5'-nucleosyl)-tetraphosphatase (symmetrical) YqeK [Candidatus Acidoferrales bacterium]|jgi:predicted HD superfamily hydrolase involved in NAD metabolism|nr:bis(5'-nucleosyl)-tetraphosphatase (symmetrical) YqeK [Candidatus Acidoferrales bacterium]